MSQPWALRAGVEHLLRDVKDSTVSTLATEVGHMVTGLKGLKTRLLDIEQYLQLVLAGKLPVNHDVIYQLQVSPNSQNPIKIRVFWTCLLDAEHCVQLVRGNKLLAKTSKCALPGVMGNAH